jgi:hypothetical protein
VGKLVARSTLARDGGKPAPAPKPEPKETPHQGVLVKIAGVGTFEAESASFDGKTSIHLTKKLDQLSTKLHELAARGQSISVEIQFAREGKPAMTVKAADGIISSHNVRPGGADPLEELSIIGTFTFDHGDTESEGKGDASALEPAAPG